MWDSRLNGPRAGALRDCRDQVLDPKGLGDDRSDPETFGYVGRVLSPTHDHYGCVFCVGGYSPTAHELVAAHQGQAQIDKQHFRPRRLRDSERVLAVESGYDVVAGLAEFQFEQSPRVVIVLDDQHTDLRHVSPAGRRTTAALLLLDPPPP